ncbi:MAG: tetratricopeptide repeat protein [bacterium]|nr:tetratricopeptide repeat protein [bacterium]
MEQEIIAGQEQNYAIAKKVSKILKNIQIYSIYLIAFLAPLFYLTITADPLFGKQILIATLTAVALFAWLIQVFITKRANYHYSIVGVALSIFLAIYFIASLLSISPGQSLFAPDPTGERFASLAICVLLAFLIATEFSRKHLERLCGVLLASGGALALFTFFSITPFLSMPRILQVNPVGALNNSAAVIIVFLFLSLGFILFPGDESRGRKIMAYFLASISAINLLLIDFKIGWIAIAALSMFFVAFYSSRFSRLRENLNSGAAISANIVFIIILGISIALTIFTIPVRNILPSLKSEVEVSPSIQATFSIGREVLKTKPLLGTGPGTFVYDYSRFRDPIVNETIFWNLKFIHGFSFVTTSISTLGSLGILAIIFLFCALFYMLAKIIQRLETIDPFEFGVSSIVLLGMIFWIIYPPTFVFNLLFFIAIGASLTLAVRNNDTASLFYGFRKGGIAIESQTLAFISSLLVIIVIILLVLAEFYSFKKYFAEVYFARGNFEIAQNGNVDTALARYASALALNPKNDRYLINQSQIYFAQAQQALNRILVGDSKAEDAFQSYLNLTLQSARQATNINPYESGNWLNLGTVYETAIPFGEGAGSFALSSYEQARQYDPISPVPLTLIGRTYIELADISDFKASKDPSLAVQADKDKKNFLEKARQALEEAVKLKSDYVAAEFLLAQAYTKDGNSDEAVRRGAHAALGAPQDVGIAFFLGFLFYQKGDIVNAEQQFSRAIEINPNYSNARYFLGLIYDKTKRSGEALKQFRRIAELNPDNTEIHKIIFNLVAGKPALTTITPPPEKRKTPPIQESVPPKSKKK